MSCCLVIDGLVVNSFELHMGQKIDDLGSDSDLILIMAVVL